ncbi:hypothetical protein J2125_002131 [Erwinia toletana]|uniref:DUF7480 domain-containing protein n=1 Tax=Winslowiella toletana TaxID=92490 RepID=A0ABS4P8H3_9GAMM|nr:putative T6SS immunity periplasmic lipoprotein [Winslowiella toletana]MBP2168939.1 hypothetical protein [Winslowiella toletana]
MNKIFLLASCSLLSACQSGDPVPVELPASAAIVNDNVCVKVMPEGDEKVMSLFIYEGNDVQHGTVKEFVPQLQVSSEECLPAPHYNWEAGKIYTWHINMASQQKIDKGVYPSNRGFVTRFKIVGEKNQKQLIPVSQ